MGTHVPSDFLDNPPESAELTDYDRSHMKLYMRVLDATNDGADWTEIAEVLFDLDAEKEPDRTRHVIETHLSRARWMTQHGYRQLLQETRD
jgi:hypothetical protein